MVIDELKYHIRHSFSFPPTLEQEHAISVFADFFADSRPQPAMILRGAAGTGKTTLAAAIVRALTVLRQKIVLLAPTGRAAKVFSLYAGHPAFTIHRRIYRQKSLMGGFTLNYNAAQDTLFIVDEASMISVSSSSDSSFFILHSSLLDDLIQFVYGGRNCRLLLIGDHAQLPPVGETESPALSAACVRSYGLDVYEANLNEVLRQASESGILFNATRIRSERGEGRGENSSFFIPHSSFSQLPQIRLQGFPDVHVVPGDELIEQLASSYSRAGLDDTIVVTRSNKRANIYNEGIRRTILDREEELCRGDRLMIVKNNYYWVSLEESGGQKASPTGGGLEGAFIANGDVATVQRIRNVHEQHGFRFAEVTLSFPDYDDYELTATVLLDTLTSESPSLTREQQTQLYERVLADYADIPRKAERLKKVKEDRYYNALQVKFAYAVTCHKAQGGQWGHVYIDQGYMTDDMLTPEYFHWLYTAFTRATEQLYLVNWPKTQVE
jgi:tRNA A37 threonylcarbamoyladenosine biosynthesis protein TsaE